MTHQSWYSWSVPCSHLLIQTVLNSLILTGNPFAHDLFSINHEKFHPAIFNNNHNDINKRAITWVQLSYIFFLHWLIGNDNILCVVFYYRISGDRDWVIGLFTVSSVFTNFFLNFDLVTYFLNPHDALLNLA